MNDALLLGDSIQLVKAVPKRSVHAIISDIPYGISYDDWDVLHANTNSALGGESQAQKGKSAFARRGKPLNGWSEADKKIPLEYQQWCAQWASAWLDTLLPGGTCFIFAGRRYAHRCIIALEDAGFTFKDMLAWEKPHAMHRAQRLSSVFKRRGDLANEKKWAGWRLANLRPTFEPILWFQKPYKTGHTITDNVLKNGVGAWNPAALEKYNIDHHESYANILEVKTVPEDHGLHPTQKPLNLMKLLVELVTQPGQRVMDPFAGSGTTLVAAKETGRKYLGIEIDPEYYQIAQQRLDIPRSQDVALF